MTNNNIKPNWYIKHRIYSEANKDIYQEAGMKENLMAGILGAIVLILSGSTISNASRETGISEEEISQAIQNDNMVNKAKNIANQVSLNTMSLGGYGDTEYRIQPSETKQELSESQKIEENIIARTIYAEGRGESSDGKRAIATVFYNRGGGNPSKIVSSIQAPKQFSCWNKAEADDWTNMKQGKGDAWEDSVNIAKSIMNGEFVPVGNYDHYFNPEKCNPSWAYEKNSGGKKIRPHVNIGNHKFMTLGNWVK